MVKKSAKTHNRLHHLIFVFTLLLISITAAGFIGCGSDNSSGTNSLVIGPDGGVLEIADPDSPIYGAKLEIPEGSVDRMSRFSLTYDASNDSDDLAAKPVTVGHEDVQLNEDVTLVLPLKARADEYQSLMIMIYDGDGGIYIPTGLMVDINAGDTSASFEIAHLSSFSLMPANDALSSDDIDHKRLHALLAELIIEIENSIGSDAGTLEEALDAMLEDHQGGTTNNILTEIIVSGERSVRSCTGDITLCADKLAESTRTLLEILPYVRGINICNELNTGEEIFACFPENSFPYIRCIPSPVSDSPDDDCMGRCGVGCPDDDNEFNGLLPCGDYFRYSQACLNHDACVRYHSLLDFRCDSIFTRLMNDCRNEQLACTQARDVCGDAKDNNGNGEIDENCLN